MRGIKLLMRIFSDFSENDELAEKLAVVIQKITYHNDLKGCFNGFCVFLIEY